MFAAQRYQNLNRMHKFSFIGACLLLLAACQSPVNNAPAAGANQASAPAPRPAYTLAIHGGAGALSKTDMTPEKEQQYRTALDSALTIGETILKSGGTALDAVTQTIVFLEDCPLFNAGRGAVFTHEGENELDASIMEGKTQAAGAIGGVKTIKNPITVARMVMEKSKHVMLTGRGAEQFAREQGVPVCDPKWFYTEARWKILQETIEKEKKKEKSGALYQNPDYKYGTVGCVALDQQGNLAAGTSTGGMTNKRWNRLGDTPVIGAGTYASNDACAISCTGHGEFFIRYAVAYDVYALMSYKGMGLADAANFVVKQKLVEKGGEGGLIAVDKNGNVALPFNSEGMYRGWAKPGVREVGIY
jgi:L-asparaginase / beta-aspartyl-peptidase